MGILANIRNRFFRSKAVEPTPIEIIHEVIDDIGEDDLEEIWVDMADDMGVLDSVDSASDFKDFALDNNVMELFVAGWVSMEGDSDEVSAAREEFFDLMAEYDISDDTFDWDSWRDWYKSE